jgi:dTDP-4-dehydrorhamnose reductase
MTTLLIGASGQLGTELLMQLPHQSAAWGPVVAACRSPELSKRCGWRTLDLASADSIRALVREVRPQVIVNAAAYTNVDAAEGDAAAAHAVNALGPGILAEEAKRIGAVLLHYSTDYVFGGRSTRPWREDDPIEPLNEYGKSKAAGEAAIRASGARHLILRTSGLYSPYGRNFVKTMFQLAAQRKELTVVNDQTSSPTSARFVATATCGILAHFAAGPDRLAEQEGTFHVACAGETSWYGFATAVFRHAAELGLATPQPLLKAVTSAEFQAAATRPKYSCLDTGKLSRGFGVLPPHWDEELRQRLPEIAAGQSTARQVTGGDGKISDE